MNPLSIRVAVDVGSTRHRVATGLPDGKLLDEFDIDHNAVGFGEFFSHIETIEHRHHLPVAVARATIFQLRNKTQQRAA